MYLSAHQSFTTWGQHSLRYYIVLGGFGYHFEQSASDVAELSRESRHTPSPLSQLNFDVCPIELNREMLYLPIFRWNKCFFVLHTIL